MLSKTDILNEIGKGICIYPLNLQNIKENSINLCAGKFAWAFKTQNIYFCEDEYDKNCRFSLREDFKYNRQITIRTGESAIVEDNRGNKYIIILPLATTLIETQEVLSLNSYIGGTYHSKVGLVSKGLGHIGTMVGPNFSGDSLIAIHNISINLIVLSVGDSFLSVVFHYLTTPYTHLNPTTSGHTDKFAELGIHVSEADSKELNQDWKKNFDEVKKKMCHSKQYKELQEDLLRNKKKAFRKYFSKRNIGILGLTIFVFIVLYSLANYADKTAGTTTWVDRYFNVGCSGIFIASISSILKYLKNNSK